MDERSKELRRLVIKAFAADKRGHVGPTLSLIEILRVLYDNFLKYRVDDPEWAERDRLILSKGHGCLALYSVLSSKGFFSEDELTTFCKHDSRLGGHPERGKLPGIEASTGALGHGLPIGVGMALAAKIRKEKHRVVVVTGDGELNEGSVWEAALSASMHKLSNLIVFVDHNKFQSYGPTSQVIDMGNLAEKWSSFGFAAKDVDGHDMSDLESLVKQLPLSAEKPTAIICHTIKGKGLPFAEQNANWHHKSGLDESVIDEMYKCLE
jgi:transketolase